MRLSKQIMAENPVTACVILIGNELLSGRTQDSNLQFIGQQLAAQGIRLKEARVIPDVPEVIVETVNSCRAMYDYVFTTGGIGPTHDDITTACVAKAFGKCVIRHPEAVAALSHHYREGELNEARLKMAEVPEGAALIPNPVSAAPGYVIENVYVLAGVPSIMQAMFKALSLKGGAPIVSESLSAYITEGGIAAELEAIQNRFPEVDIGSYPFFRHGKVGTSLVGRSENPEKLQGAMDAIRAMLESHRAEIISSPS